MIENFWLICGIWCGIFNAVFMHFDLRKAVAEGQLSPSESKNFTLGSFAWIFFPCVIFWLLQRSIGPDFSPDFKTWPDPQRLIALSLTVLIWGALLYWVFLADGALKLAKVARASSWTHGIVLGPKGIKILSAVLVAAGIASIFLSGA